jgi:tRNA 2-thiouridine synthesizing protein B
MLYTFANREYDIQWLQQIFQQLTAQDMVLLWQDGVLLPLKYPTLFNQLAQYLLLENDVVARGIAPVLSNCHKCKMYRFISNCADYRRLLPSN